MVLNNITPAMATYMEQGYTYTEEEDSVSKKTEVVYENGIGNYFVKIPKIISLGAEKACKYSVQVKGDIASDKMVYVSPIDSIEDSDATDFYMIDQSTVNRKQDVTATVNQTKEYWNFKDVADEYTETENNISAPDLSAGTWKGTFNFEINLLNDDGSVIVHDYVGKVLRTASCTENGEKLFSCNHCEQSYVEVIPALGHNLVNDVCSLCGTSVQSVSEIEETDTYETGTVVSVPENSVLTINGETVEDDSYTFTEAGTYEVTIETTDHETGEVTVVTKNIVVEAHEHNYTEKVLTAPTCVDEGEKELSCSCGSKKYEVIPSTGHNVVYGRCTNCGVVVQNTSDLQEVEEETISYDKGAVLEVEDDEILKVDGLVVPDNNYTFTEEGEYDVEIQTTDPETGEKVVVNKHITVGTHEHNYSEKVLISPSCLNEGKKELTCSSCGSIKYEAIPATGHEIVDGHCTQCDVVVKSSNDLVADASETENQVTYEAGTVLSVPEDSVLTVDGEVVEDGVYTFEEEGKHTVTIETTNPEANEKETVEVEINIGSHEHNYIENIIKSSTCTEAGEKKLVCSCGNVKYEVIPALGHNVVDDNCTRCGAIIKDASQEESKNVTYYPGTIVTVPEDSTLIVDGKVVPEGSYTFEDEGKHRVEVETINPETGEKETTKITVTVTPHEHEYSETVLLEANCVEDGEKRLTCECGNSKLVVIPATGHNIVANKCTQCDVTVKKPVNLEKEDNISYEKGTVVSVPEDTVLKVNGEIIEDGIYTFDEEGTYTVTIESTDADGNPVITEKEVTVEKHEHKYVETIVTEPNCIDDGLKTFSCSCGSVKKEVLFALGHEIVDGFCTRCDVTVKSSDDLVSDTNNSENGVTYEAGTVISVPEDSVLTVDGEVITEGSYTFDEEGTHTVKIETTNPETGEVETIETKVTISSHEHNYSVNTTKLPNCVEAGEKVLTCSCGSTKKEVIPATGHSINSIGKCTKCNAIIKNVDDLVYDSQDAKEEDEPFSYEKGTVVTVSEYEKLIVDGVVIPEGTYIFDEEGDYKVRIETTDPVTGEKKVVEKDVTIISHEHNYKEKVTVEPTCTSDGKVKLSCTCGSVKYETLPALGHEIKDGSCTRCGVIIKTEEDIQNKEEVTYNEGTEITVPDDSVLTVDGVVIPEGNYTFDKEGTYTVTIETTNPVTGEVTTTETKVTVTAHSHNYVTSILEDANCVEDGKKELSCSCGSVKYEVIPATGHEIVDGKCTKCEVIIIALEELGTEKEVTYESGVVIDIPENGVLKIDDVIITENPYTLTEEGTHKVVIETTNPETGEKTRDKTLVTVTSHTHNYKETVLKDATCTENGEKRLTCTCGSVKYEALDALGHDYSSTFTVDKAETCTEVGSKSKHCSRCDSKSEVTVIPANGHSYDSGVITTQPTCTERGIKTFTCTVCKFTRTEDVSALGHDYSSSFTTDKEATCTEVGSKSKHCSRCDSKSEVTVIPAKGHSYNSGVITTQPTCTETGIKTFTCTVCNSTRTESVFALGHNYLSTYTIDTAATCTTAGSKSQHCTRCSAKQNITSIPATGHSYINNSAYVSRTSSSRYSFIQNGNKWTSDNQGVQSSTATATWTINATTDTNFIFKYKVSSEANYDKLTITLDDNIIVNGISGNGNELTYTTTLSSGTHTLKATYVKDGSSDQYDDCAYLILYNHGHVCNTCFDYQSHNYVNDVCTIGGESYLDNNWNYTLNNSNNTVTLNYYIGQETNVYVNDSYVINGKTYTTKLASNVDNATSDTPYMFNNQTSVKSVTFNKNINTSNVTNMSYMFNYCYSLTSSDLSCFDTSNVIDMSYMFSDCQSLTGLDISNFRTSKVKNMRSMFSYCEDLTNLNISNFDTSNVTNMGSMFDNCLSLTSLNVSNFNTSNVTNMGSMFDNCLSLTSLNVSNFNTSKVTNMSYMFYYCESLTSLAVNNFDTSNVTNMAGMFNNCSSLTQLVVDNFDTNNVLNMNSMFKNCSSLTSLVIGSYSTDTIFTAKNVTDMSYMFYGCSSIKYLYLESLNTNKVTNMSYMFANCPNLYHIWVSPWNWKTASNATNIFLNSDNAEICSM